MSFLSEVHPDDGNHGASPESKKEISIYINTRECLVAKTKVTYQDLVTLAFPGEVANPDKVFEITYSSEHGPDGSVGVGGEINLKEGMVFNVGITNRS
jgi:Multiubiquitin